MLIVALQDDIDNLYAIWNTVTDRFLGVNLTKEKAAKIVADYKGCDFEGGIDRVEHPQPFSDIAKIICGWESEIEEKVKIISDGEIAQVYIDGKKVSCTDIVFIGHAKDRPMITIDAVWKKTDEDGNQILDEDGLSFMTEGIKINC